MSNIENYWIKRKETATLILSEVSFLSQLVSINFIIVSFLQIMIGWVYSLWIGLYATLVIQYIRKRDSESKHLTYYDLIFFLSIGQALLWINMILGLFLCFITLILSLEVIFEQDRPSGIKLMGFLSCFIPVAILAVLTGIEIEPEIVGTLAFIFLLYPIVLILRFRKFLDVHEYDYVKIQIGFLMCIGIAGLTNFMQIEILTGPLDSVPGLGPFQFIGIYSLYFLLLAGAIYLQDFLSRDGSETYESISQRNLILSSRLTMILFLTFLSASTLTLGQIPSIHMIVLALLSAIMLSSVHLLPSLMNWLDCHNNWHIEGLLLVLLSSLFIFETLLFLFIDVIRYEVYFLLLNGWYVSLIIAVIVFFGFLKKWGIRWAIPSIFLSIFWIVYVYFSIISWGTTTVFEDPLTVWDLLDMIFSNPELITFYLLHQFVVTTLAFSVSIFGCLCSNILLMCMKYFIDRPKALNREILTPVGGIAITTEGFTGARKGERYEGGANPSFGN